MQTISELEKRLQFVKKKDKVDTLVQLAELCMDEDLQSASLHARNARKLARKLKLKQQQATASRLLANTLFFTARYRNALDLLGESLSLTREINDLEGQSTTLLDLGKNHFKINEYDKSVEFYYAALTLAQEQKDNSLQAEIMYNLALININTGDYEQAKENLLNVIKIWKYRSYEAGLFNALLNLGVIAFQQDKIDEARAQTNKALELADKIGKENYLAAVNNSLAQFLIKENRYENALDLLLEFVEILEENDQAVWVYGDIINNIALCYLRLNDLEQAKENAVHSLKIAREIGSKLLIVKNLEIISELALEEQNYKVAYESTNELHELKQLIYEKEAAAKIAEIRLRSGIELKTRRSPLTEEKRTLSEDVLKQKIKEIIRDNEQFQLIVESSEDIITLHDSKGKYLYCNRPFLYSFKAEDLIGKSPYNFYKFEYGDALVRQIKYTYSSGKSNHMDSLIEVDGQDKWFTNYIYPVTDQDGNIVAVAMLSRYKIEETAAEFEQAPSMDDGLIKQLEGLNREKLIWESFREDVRKFVTFRVELNDDAPIKQKVIYFSSSLKDVLGINLADDFAKWFQNIDQDEKEILINNFRNTVEKGKSLNQEIKIFHPERNQYRWVEMLLDPVFSKNKVAYLNGIITDITSRKEEEKALINKLKAARLNKELLQISSQAYVLTELDGKIVDYNRALMEITGYSKKALTDLNWQSNFTNEDFLPLEKKILETLRSAGKHQVYEKSIPAANNQQIETEVSVHAILNDEAKIHRYCYFITDVSSRNQLIAQLRTSNQEMNSLLQNLPEALLEIDENGLIINIIPTLLAEKLGLQQELEGSYLGEIFPESFLTDLKSSIPQSLETEKPVKLEFLHNGMMLQADTVKTRENILLLLIKDISGLKEAEGELEKSRKKYLDIFHRSPQPLCLFSATHKIETANAAFTALTGFSLDELQAKHLKDLVTDQEMVKRITEQLADAEFPKKLDAQLVLKNHSTLPVNLNCEIMDDRGQLLISWQDISGHLEQLNSLTQQFQLKEEDYQDKLKALEKEADKLNQQLISAAEAHQASLSEISAELAEKDQQYQDKINEIEVEIQAGNEQHQTELDNLNAKLKDKEEEYQSQLNELKEQLHAKEEEHQAYLSKIDTVLIEKDQQYQDKIKAIEAEHQIGISKIDEVLLAKEHSYEEKIEEILQDIRVKESEHQEKLDVLNRQLKDKEQEQLSIIDELNEKFSEKEQDYQNQIQEIKLEIRSKENEYQAEVDKLNQQLQVKENQQKSSIAEIDQEFITKEKEFKEKIHALEEELTGLKKLMAEPTNYASFQLAVDIDRDDLLRVTSCSSSLKKLCGTDTIDNFDTWFLNVVEEDKTQLQDAWKKLIGSTKSLDVTFRLQHPDLQKIFWLRLIADPEERDNKLSAVNGILFDVTAAKLVEQELRDKLREVEVSAVVLREFSQPFVVCDAHGLLLQANHSFCQLTGYKSKELINKISWDKLTADNQVTSFSELVFASGETHIEERELQPKKGMPLAVKFILHPYFNKQGELEKIFCFVLDLSTLKLAISQLKETETGLRSLFKILPQDILLLDHNAAIIEILNLSTASELPVTEEDIGKKLSSLLPLEAADAIQKGVEQCLKQQGSLEIEYSFATASQQKWQRGKLHYKSDNAVYFFSTDITEQQQLHDNISELQDRFSHIYNNTPIAMLTLDPQFNFIEINSAAEKLIGISDKDIRQMNLKDLETQSYQLLKPYQQVLKGNTIENLEQQLEKENNAISTFINHSFPLKNEQDKLKLILSFWIDISDRKVLEKQLQLTKQGLGKATDEKIQEYKKKLEQMNALLNSHENMAFFSLISDTDDPTDLRINFASASLKKLLQLKVMGNLKNWATNIHPDDVENFFALIENSRQEYKAATGNFRVKENWLRLDLQASRNTTDQIILNGVFTEVTQSRKDQLERESRLEEFASYATLLKNSPIAFMECDSNHRILKVNNAFCKLTGYQEAELQKSNNWMKLLAGRKFGETHRGIFQQVLEKKKIKRLDTVWTNKEGDFLKVELTISVASPEADDKYLIFASDISDIASIIEHLQNSEAQLQKVISYLPYDLLELDHNGKIRQVINVSGSDRFLEEVDPEEDTLHSIYPGKTPDKILTALQKCLKDRSHDQIRFTVAIEEDLFWYEAILIYKDENSLIFIPEEITDTIRLEDQYQEILHKYKSGIETCPIPFLSLDLDLKIQYLNKAASNFLDLSSENARGKSIIEFDPGKTQLITKLAKVQQGKSLINFEQEIIDSQANPISILSYFYPVKDESGKVININSMWIDISNYKLLEKELKIKKASLEKSVDENIKELTEKLASYETLIQDQSRFGFFRAELINKKAVISFHNKALFKLLGSGSTTDLQELLSKLPEGIREEIFKLLEHSENEQQVIDETVELNLEKKKWIRVCLNFPVQLNKGSRVVQGIVFDVTEQVLKVAELNENIASINRAEEILYESEQPFVVLSRQNKLLNYNVAFKKLTGYSSDQLSQLNWLDTINTADAVEAEASYFSKLSKANSSVTFQRKFKGQNSKLVDVEIKAHTRGDENSELYIFLTDLSELKEINTKLETELTNMKLLLDKLPALTVQINAADQITQIFNNSLSEVIDLSSDSAGSELQELLPEAIAVKVIKFIAQFRKDQLQNRIDLPIKTEDQLFWLEMELTDLDNENILLVIRDISKRKTDEISLQKDSSNFKALFENTPLPVITFDANCRFTSANQQAQDLLGYNLEELLKFNLRDVELYDHGSSSAVDKLLKGEDLINFEQLLKGKDGRQLTILHNAYVIKDKTDRITSIQSALINITERRKKEEKLQQQLTGSTAEVEERISNLNSIISSYDAFFKEADSYAVFKFSLNSLKLDQQKIELSSPSLCRLIDNHEIKVFKDLLKNVVMEDRSQIESACQVAIANRKSFNGIFRVKTTEANQLKWLNLSFDPVQDKQGNYSANGFVNDVTELKNIQIRLQENEQHLEKMIATLPFVFYTTTLNGKFTHMSPSFRQLFDLPDDQQKLTWNDISSNTPENSAARKTALDSLTKGEPVADYSLELINSKGRKFRAEIKEAPVIQNGETISIVGVLKDLSRQEQIEAELQLIRNAALACEQAMIITDPELKIIFASNISAKLFGLKGNQEIIGRNLTELLHVDDKTAFKKQLHQDLVKVNKWQDELELLQTDKTVIRKMAAFKAFKGWQEKDFLAVSFQDILDTKDLQNQIEFFREELETQKAKVIRFREEQKMLEDSINIAGIGVWNWNISKNEIQCSEGFFKILGLKKLKKIIDLELFKQLIHPQKEIELSGFLKTARSSDEKKDLKLTVIDPQGKSKHLELHTITYFDEKKPSHLLGVVYQLEEIPAAQKPAAVESEKAATPALQGAASTTALMDIHQQVITHLIDRQPDFSSSNKNELTLKAIEERAEIISLILRMAMSSKDPNTIVFQNFLQNLLQNFGRKMGAQKLVSMRINARQIKLPIEQAIPCGLIVNELVNNSINFAFPENRKTFFENTIKIDMKKNEDGYLLSISDNGVGLAENFNFETHSSTGLKLVKLWVVQQLKGSYLIDPEKQPGVTFRITFKP